MVCTLHCSEPEAWRYGYHPEAIKSIFLPSITQNKKSDRIRKVENGIVF